MIDLLSARNKRACAVFVMVFLGLLQFDNFSGAVSGFDKSFGPTSVFRIVGVVSLVLAYWLYKRHY